jgi:hypothetical protein
MTYTHAVTAHADSVSTSGTLLRTADPAGGNRWQEPDDDGRSVTHVLFDLSSGGGQAAASGFASIDYRGTRYTVHSITDMPESAVRDHSMEALSLLNELVSVAKVSSDIPNTQSIQIVP